jgi:hypothetical protein
MQESKTHHHVPVFYLSRWSGDDGKVHVIRNIKGRVVRSSRAPQYLGFECLLYSYAEDFEVADRAEIETMFFKPLDSEGAKIVAKMIAGLPLKRRDYIIWAQFLTAMKVRTPETVEKIRIEGSKALVREMESAQVEYEKLRGEADPPTAVAWVQVNRPGLMESIGVRQLPKIASYAKAMQDVLSFSWHIVSFGNSTKSLLTSDRPCVYTGGLDEPDCIIALPLTPSFAFFAFRRNSRAQFDLMTTPVSRLAARLNHTTVSQAVARAYCQGAGDAPDLFFLRRLAWS